MRAFKFKKEMFEIQTKVKTKFLEYVFLEFSVFFFSLSGIFFKFASKNIFMSFNFIAFYSMGLMILAIYSFFWQIILKEFELYVAYGNRAMVTIWSFIWSFFIFHETINFKMIFGGILITIGTILLVVKNDK